MSRRIGRLATVVVDVAAVLGLLAVLALVACLLTGARPVVLTSGSMSPTMSAGSVALTVPVAGAQVETGQVLTVPTADGSLVTHRVVRVTTVDDRVLAELRGDANPVPDAEDYDVTDGARRVVAHVPWVGRLLAAVRGPWLAVGAAALVVVALAPSRAPAGVDGTDEREAAR